MVILVLHFIGNISEERYKEKPVCSLGEKQRPVKTADGLRRLILKSDVDSVNVVIVSSS